MEGFRIPAYPVDDHGKLLVTRQLAAGAPQERVVYLGRKGVKPGAPTLMLDEHFEGLKSLPPAWSYASKAMDSIRRVLGNDQQGNCVIASGGHGLGLWSANDSTIILQTAQEALSEYHRIGGPGDNGLYIPDALEDWRKNGLLAGGKRYKIDGWAGMRISKELVWAAGYGLGGFRIGFNVPQEWMSGIRDGFVWRPPSRYSFVGGHDVRITGCSEAGVEVATWGLLGTMSWEAFLDSRIVDEAYVELSPNWYNEDRLSPLGFNVDALVKALGSIRNGEVPAWEGPNPDPGPDPDPDPNPQPPKRYAVTIPDQRIQVRGGLFASTYTGVWKGGTYEAQPLDAAGMPTAESDEPTWLQALRIVGRIIVYAADKDVMGVWTNVMALVQLFRAQNQLRGAGPVVPWWQIVADASALLTAVMKRDWPAVITAILKLASDFGLSLDRAQLATFLSQPSEE